MKEKAKYHNPDTFQGNKRKIQRKYKNARQEAQQESSRAKSKCKAYQNRQINAKERFRRFKLLVRFGPIFVCSSCYQKMFRHQVQILDKTLEQKIKAKSKEIYRQTIPKTARVPVEINIREKGVIKAEKKEWENTKIITCKWIGSGQSWKTHEADRTWSKLYCQKHNISKASQKGQVKVEWDSWPSHKCPYHQWCHPENCWKTSTHQPKLG